MSRSAVRVKRSKAWSQLLMTSLMACSPTVSVLTPKTSSQMTRTFGSKYSGTQKSPCSNAEYTRRTISTFSSDIVPQYLDRPAAPEAPAGEGSRRLFRRSNGFNRCRSVEESSERGDFVPFGPDDMEDRQVDRHSGSAASGDAGANNHGIPLFQQNLVRSPTPFVHQAKLLGRPACHLLPTPTTHDLDVLLGLLDRSVEVAATDWIVGAPQTGGGLPIPLLHSGSVRRLVAAPACVSVPIAGPSRAAVLWSAVRCRRLPSSTTRRPPMPDTTCHMSIS